MQPIIVGIDPGTTSAFAAVSFDFKVLKVKSKRNYSFSELISDIYSAGNPIIVGTDKKDVPSFIKNFSQKTGAKVFAPAYDTKKDEKKFVVKESRLLDFVSNAHETDALASAIFAYKKYKPLIEKINNYTAQNNKTGIRDKIYEKVISKDISIMKAAEIIEVKPKKRITGIVSMPPSIKKELTREQREILFLKSSVERLKVDAENLRKENERLRKKKIDIGKETKKIISFKERRALSLESEVRGLKKELAYKEKIIDILNIFISKSKNRVLLKRLDNLGQGELSKKSKMLNIEKGDILLVDDISIASPDIVDMLKGKIDVIIYLKGPNKAIENFLLLEKKALDLLESKYFALALKDKLEAEIQKIKDKRKKNKDYLVNILEEYRKERLKDI